MNITIRPADIEKDALAIMDGAKDFASRVSFQSLFPKGEDFIKAVGRIVALNGVEILLAEYQDKVVGGIGVLYAPYLWNPDLLVGDELFLWAHKDAPYRTGRLLIDEAMKRIDERKAIPMFRALDTSPKGVEKTYKNYSLRPIETVFARVPEWH